MNPRGFWIRISQCHIIVYQGVSEFYSVILIEGQRRKRGIRIDRIAALIQKADILVYSPVTVSVINLEEQFIPENCADGYVFVACKPEGYDSVIDRNIGAVTVRRIRLIVQARVIGVRCSFRLCGEAVCRGKCCGEGLYTGG